MTQDENSYTMKAGDAAQLLKVSRETVHNYADQGRLKFISRTRGRTKWKYFNPAEVEELAKVLNA